MKFISLILLLMGSWCGSIAMDGDGEAVRGRASKKRGIADEIPSEKDVKAVEAKAALFVPHFEQARVTINQIQEILNRKIEALDSFAEKWPLAIFRSNIVSLIGSIDTLLPNLKGDVVLEGENPILIKSLAVLGSGAFAEQLSQLDPLGKEDEEFKAPLASLKKVQAVIFANVSDFGGARLTE
jgi:hypothetical protein